MRIAIDIRSLQTTSAWRGVGVYTEQLVRSLMQIDKSNEYILLCSSRRKLPDLPEEIGRKIVPLRRPGRGITVWDQLFSYRSLKKMKVDIFHSPFYATPLAVSGAVGLVQTIHDLTPILFKGSTSLKHRMIFNINFHCARYADKIIAVSENTKKDIVRVLGIPEDKIAVIYNGIDHLPVPYPGGKRPDQDIREMERPYLLYVGGLDRVKNVPVLIQAFGKILKKYDHMKLLIVGADCEKLISLMKRTDWRGSGPPESSREFASLCESLLRSGRMVLKGYLGKDELLSCYREAELFVFPSLYEGFGLPPLEAMSAGVPVIASGRASLPEILGDAAIYVNPEDPDELAALVDRVLSDDALKEKMKLAGVKRAGEFRWERTARMTLDLYEALHEMKKSRAER